MDGSFWHQKWERNDIGFHESKANPLLVKHFGALELAQGARVFLPLCGKTLDIHWLLSTGYRVAGAELSMIAVQQLFAELEMTPDIEKVGNMHRYSGENIDIFVGDIFQLSANMLAAVDAVYDRAALVALPADLRTRYTAHLPAITEAAPQLLICYEYDQSQLEGPPFSISKEEIDEKYGNTYDVTLLDHSSVAGGLKGKLPATEFVWLLK
jgi:thiopurine S-methyltransferase